MSVNSKMTALADEIRELSGTATKKSLDAMASDVDAANTEIAEQAELLEQIATALEGKAAGADTSDTTATASEIFAGETAYIAEGKVTGTFTIEEELTEQNDLISQITTLVATKANYNTLYITTTTPTDDMGVNGDICIVTEVAE